MPIKNVLLSVSDKAGLPELAAALLAAGCTIYSTGGTAAALKKAGCRVVDISELTDFVEILDGRVKTLHPYVYAAILADMNNQSHIDQLNQYGLPKFDLVVVNFYPFEQTVAKGAPPQEIIENIDIGGPSMVRAAVKNYHSTLVLTEPADYPVFIGHLKRGDEFNEQMRRRLAAKALINIAHLDGALANYFSRPADGDSHYPSNEFFHLEKIADLPYGENPHQQAACYRLAGESGGFIQLHGAPLSYNNLLDAGYACSAISGCGEPTAVVVKHNNPCGMATADTLKEAFSRAWKADAVSAYGGVVAVNRPLDEETAQLMQESYWEVIIAPQFSEEAKQALAIKERVRLLIPPAAASRQVSSIGRLLLMQSVDEVDDSGLDHVVSREQPTAEQREELRFAWRVAAAVKSNAVVLVRQRSTIGIGAGQMSRVDSAMLACEKARRGKFKIAGSAAASDGFFPFADGVEVLAEAGVTAIVQPGGSKNDDEVIAAADKAGVVMVMTGKRHFRH